MSPDNERKIDAISEQKQESAAFDQQTTVAQGMRSEDRNVLRPLTETEEQIEAFRHTEPAHTQSYRKLAE